MLRPRVPSLRMYSAPVILSAGCSSTEDRLHARCQDVCFKQQLSLSLEPAVKLSGRVSIYEPLYYYSELLSVFCVAY